MSTAIAPTPTTRFATQVADASALNYARGRAAWGSRHFVSVEARGEWSDAQAILTPGLAGLVVRFLLRKR
jgi:hypothetical protein